MIEKYRTDWNNLAAFDAKWAILSDPGKKFGRWDTDQFFATGMEEIEAEFSRLEALHLSPGKLERALDFGCGLGRLTRAMGLRFTESIGVDISDTMIAGAKALNAAFPNCVFLVNARPDLSLFPADHFDFIYTARVLQHIPAELVRSYIREFLRVLRPDGLLVFHLPHELPLIFRLQPRRTAYKALSAIGFAPEFLMNKCGLHPMRLTAISRDSIVTLLSDYGATLLYDESSDKSERVPSTSYYVRK